jgi:hypothetical protein
MVVKLALLALGIANAVLFRVLWKHHLDDWDILAPRLGRAQAALSAGVWIAVPVAGRLIAYL